MVNQHVFRGGCSATPTGHVRETYRNFFPPAARWAFSGARLAATRKAERNRLMAHEPALTVDVHLPPDHRRAAMAANAESGLTASPKTLPPVWFYDERQRPVRRDHPTPEYYPTRAERRDPAAHADEIVQVAKADVLVELGSGTSDKTRLLLDAMAGAGTLQRFVPFDVSEETLRHAAAAIMKAYEIPVHTIVGDFHRHLGTIPRAGRRLVAFLGSTIGNLDPAQRRRFLFDLDATLDYDDWLLLGTDLVKDARASSPHTTMPRVSPRRSTGTCSACSTASSARTSSSTRSITWHGGTTSNGGSRCCSGRHETRRSRSTISR